MRLYHASEFERMTVKVSLRQSRKEAASMPFRRAVLPFLALSVVALLVAASLSLFIETSAAPALQETPTPEHPRWLPNRPRYALNRRRCLSALSWATRSDNDFGKWRHPDLYVQLSCTRVQSTVTWLCLRPCHTTVGEYPHPQFSASDRRNVTEQLNNTCARCPGRKVILLRIAPMKLPAHKASVRPPCALIAIPLMKSANLMTQKQVSSCKV